MTTIRTLAYLLRRLPTLTALRMGRYAEKVAMSRHHGEPTDDGIVCTGHGRDYPAWPCREYATAKASADLHTKAMNVILTP